MKIIKKKQQSETCEQQYLNVEEAKIKNFINGTVVDANK